MNIVLAQVLRCLGLALVALTVAVGPYGQGLFFPSQQYLATAAIATGFLLWSIALRVDRRQFRFWVDWIEISVFSLLVCYVIASFTAVFPQGHLNVILQMLAGLLTFYMAREESIRWPATGRLLAWIFIVASVGIVAIGLAPYVGINPPDGLTEVARRLWGPKLRVSSTFEYPNTLAIYVTFAWLVLTGLALGVRHKTVILPIASLTSYLYALTFLLASSRGALLVFPLAVALLVIALPRTQRVGALLLIGGTMAIGFATMKGVDGNAALSDWPRVYKWLAAGSATAVLGGFILAAWIGLPTRWQLRILAAVGTLTLATVVIAIMRYGSLASAAETLLSPKAKRLLDLNWQTTTAMIRLHYQADALEIVRDHPLLGAGGRGWERLYPQYQSYRYVASETHNHFFQVAIEAGIPGLLAFLAFWGTLAWTALRDSTRTPISRILATGVVAIALHSALDFNLSYFALWLVICAVGGVVAADAKHSYLRTFKTTPTLVAVISGVILTIGLSHTVGAQALRKADVLIEAGNPIAAIRLLERASFLMPLAPDPWGKLADIKAGSPAELEFLRHAYILDDRNHLWPHRLSIALARQDELNDAFDIARDAVRLQPTWGLYYQNALDAGIPAVVDAILNGNETRTQVLLQQLESLVDQFETQQREAFPYARFWESAYPAHTPILHLRSGQVRALTGQYEVALSHLLEAQREPALLAQAEIWMALIYEQQGHESALQELEDRLWIRFLPLNPIHPVLELARNFSP